MNYPTLLVRCIELAAEWHVGQTRMHPTRTIPYIAHPVSVGFLLQREGCDEETVAAGLLHDVIEDCGITQEEIAHRATPRVAELVSWVTELPKSEYTWHERKIAYRERLMSAPPEALLVCAADHVCNLHSLRDAAQESADVWELFRSDRAERMAHERDVLHILRTRSSAPLVDVFASALSDLEQHLASV